MVVRWPRIHRLHVPVGNRYANLAIERSKSLRWTVGRVRFLSLVKVRSSHSGSECESQGRRVSHRRDRRSQELRRQQRAVPSAAIDAPPQDIPGDPPNMNGGRQRRPRAAGWELPVGGGLGIKGLHVFVRREIALLSNGTLDMSLASAAMPEAPRFYVYVIELRHEVYQETKFARENSGWTPAEGRSCYYVGQSAHKPGCRYRQHKAKTGDGAVFTCQCPLGAAPKTYWGSNSFARVYGVCLATELYRKHNPLPSRERAEEMEKELAEELRAVGHAVWWN